MKRKIDVFEHVGEILAALKKHGILLNTQADGQFNTMTIGWGTLGVEWLRPIFTVYVRTSRFTYDLLEKNPQFTISVPVGEFDKSILGKAGRLSGRKVDKVKECGLTLEEAEVNGVPGLKELPLTIECRVVYKNLQETKDITIDTVGSCYPKGQGAGVACNEYPHVAYYGEIVAAYIIE
ncbi:MAG: flavin reductase [bacterium]|nr:flavin reductase [bacterium]